MWKNYLKLALPDKRHNTIKGEREFVSVKWEWVYHQLARHLTLHPHGHCRPGKFFEGFWIQTPPLSLTQYLTAYQFLGPSDNVVASSFCLTSTIR